jgi:RNA polymerase sigma-70 factor (family 1)
MSEKETDIIDFIDQFQKGEESAFNLVFNQFYNAIYFFTCRIVSTQQEARDITSDTFMKVWMLRENFKNLANIKAFLYLTARNASIDYLRQRKKQQLSQKEILYLSHEDAPGTDLDMIRAEFYNELNLQIEQLPRQCGIVFRMIFFFGKKTHEIAAELNISSKTVLAHKRNAVMQLRSELLKKDLIFLITFMSLITMAA